MRTVRKAHAGHLREQHRGRLQGRARASRSARRAQKQSTSTRRTGQASADTRRPVRHMGQRSRDACGPVAKRPSSDMAYSNKFGDPCCDGAQPYFRSLSQRANQLLRGQGHACCTRRRSLAPDIAGRRSQAAISARQIHKYKENESRAIPGAAVISANHVRLPTTTR